MTELAASMPMAENSNPVEQRSSSENPRPLNSTQALQVKVLLQALCYISRDLPLPQSVWDSVSSISQKPSHADAAARADLPSAVASDATATDPISLNGNAAVEIAEAEAREVTTCIVDSTQISVDAAQRPLLVGTSDGAKCAQIVSSTCQVSSSGATDVTSVVAAATDDTKLNANDDGPTSQTISYFRKAEETAEVDAVQVEADAVPQAACMDTEAAVSLSEDIRSDSGALPSSFISQISSQVQGGNSPRQQQQDTRAEGNFTFRDDQHARDGANDGLAPPKKGDEEKPETSCISVTFEEALSNHCAQFSSSSLLKQELEGRAGQKLSRRVHELEETPLYVGEELRMRSLIELQALKLSALQAKVMSDIMAERNLQQACSAVDKNIFDWGLMRLVRTPSSFFGALHGDGYISGLSPVEADERLRRKREAERQRRLEEEEQARVTMRKRKFFNELLNFVREMQLQAQAVYKRRKQRNDSVLVWHGKQRQRATRAERLRFQALKADDQEAYMKMVEESKNERLTTLLQKTDELLQRLGAMVQMQKDADRADGVKKEKSTKGKDAGKGLSGLSSPRQKKNEPDGGVEDPLQRKIKENNVVGGEDQAESDGEGAVKKRDLLQGQRQYNSLVHAIEEKVTKQPSMLTGGELRPYQLEGLQWMLSLYNNNLNGILADEMGLGKTIQTIALLSYLMENKGLSGPHLIIAPKAVLPNWDHEFRTWAPSIVAVLYDGNRLERKGIREIYKGKGSFNVLVTHYDLIMRDKAFLKKIFWHYMIVDEGHRLKNQDCILSKTLVKGYHIRRRLLLTGTPIQNSLEELWALLNFLLPAIFNSCTNFEEWFNAPFADPSEMSLTEEEQLLIIRRLHQVIRPFLLRRKKAEVEKFLPIKAQIILKCDMSAWQRVYYQQITEQGRVGLDCSTGKSRSLQNTAMQLRKCCNHPYIFLDHSYNIYRKDEILRASGKFELLDRILPKLQRTGHRVLLFSQMTRLLDILEIYLNFQGFKYLRLDGGTKTENRGTLLAKFNAPDSPFFLFLLSTRAGGLGLNLQTADTVILFDSDWNPQMDQQAEDRAHRIGQKKEVRVFVLASVGTIEEDILDRAKSKMGIDAKVIQAGLFNTTSTAQERRELLEEIMRRGAQSLGTDVPSEREINRLAARTEDEFRLFEKMDEERRKKEGYKSRLMEQHEVPEWVFRIPKNTVLANNAVGGEISGKRKRKEVIYTDALSESQYFKAFEEGDDLPTSMKKHLLKKIKKDLMPAYATPPVENGDYHENFSSLEASASYGEGESMVEAYSSQKRQLDSYDSADTADVAAHVEQRSTQKLQILKFKHPRKPVAVEASSVLENGQGYRIMEHPLNWKGLKRKRSSHGAQAQNEENGQSSWIGGASKDDSGDY
ncbi:hypothetical protein GOP47_0026942 [Adiantum capillus-veneris]|nr:hypothetical protein GOP47_0026419 [Adiantum capillus-veneris]KAI5058772.1 hypothetical protein GOP47_0026942 [Adiantum capillus-veneris]